MSSTRLMMAGSFDWTRTIGIVSLPSIACSWPSSVWKSPWPCSMSTRSQSKPARLMISALIPLHMESQAPAVGRPSRSARLT